MTDNWEKLDSTTWRLRRDGYTALIFRYNWDTMGGITYVPHVFGKDHQDINPNTSSYFGLLADAVESAEGDIEYAVTHESA